MAALHLELHAAGAGVHPAGWSKPLTRLPWHVLVANLDGYEELQVDGRSQRIGPGQAFLIEAGRPHRIHSPGGNRSAWAAVSFGPSVDGEPLACADVLGATPPVLAPPAVARLACERLPALAARAQRDDPLAHWEALAALAGLLGLWCRRGTRPPGSPRRRDPALAIAAAEDALALGRGPSSVAGLAAAAGLDRSQFSRWFRRLRGCSPQDYLRQRQLALAAALLAEGRLPIADIARRCGYRDPAAFARAYRRHHGHPPSAERGD